MKAVIYFILALSFVLTKSQTQSAVCDICILDEPSCPVGEVSSGGPGCWGCCRPVCRTVCVDPLSDIAIRPPCDPVEIQKPSSTSNPPHEVCWHLLLKGANAVPQIVSPVPCQIPCSPIKPACTAGEVSLGEASCWGCCRPICRTICENLLSDIIINQGCLPGETQSPSPESDPPVLVCWQCCLTYEHT
ncbi:hypothetical protein CVT26_005839 [Gymnopilus dilepis]|uniref:4Fe-4S ferredoxin-type domain-containing protein n=1 Tax=Gymnopilus dilepis TaxID=231916 RepID=A0A409VP11_9AGAR|nr:hypothetical protein CVT26_005839 [Gymnopilus dilepis]